MAVVLIQFRFIFSLRNVKISSFALPKKTVASAQLIIVALTKATSLVRSFSDLCSYKVFSVLLNTDKDFKINFASSVTLGQKIQFGELFVAKSQSSLC